MEAARVNPGSTSLEPEAVAVARRSLTSKLTTGSVELPLLPHIATRLLPLLADPKSDARQLAALIRQDQSLTGHTLRIANSAAFGGRTRVDSLQHAVARLGLALLRGLVLAVSLQDGVFQCRRFESEARAWWRHALATALFAERVAQLRKRDGEVAFVCGLLHSIGRPVALNALVRVMTKEELNLTREQVLSLVEELHVTAGELVVVRWHLADVVADAIRCCADPMSAVDCSFEATTALLASHLAHRALDPDAADDELVARLGLDPGQIEALSSASEQVAQQVEAVAC